MHIPAGKKILWGTIGIMLLLGGIFYQVEFNYLRLAPPCRIRLHGDILRGDKSLVRDLLDALAVRDTEGFRVLCANIDDIHERYCLGGDPRFSSPREWQSKTGCYIKGSRILYISPKQYQASPTELLRRTDDLARLARHAEVFWTKR